MSAVGLAIITMLTWGAGDLPNVLVARKVGALEAAWLTYTGGVWVYLPFIAAHFHDASRLNAHSLITIIAASVLVALGWICFMGAYEHGPITVAGSVANCFPVVVVIESVLFLNEHVNVTQSLLILTVIVGIVLCSLDLRDLKKVHLNSRGLAFALGAMLGTGSGTMLLKPAVDHVGFFIPALTSQIIGWAIVTILMKRRKKTLHQPADAWPMAILATLLTTGAYLLFNYALTKGDASVVTPIAGGAPVIFALLSYFYFREPMSRRQFAGVAVSLAGVVALAIATS